MTGQGNAAPPSNRAEAMATLAISSSSAPVAPSSLETRKRRSAVSSAHRRKRCSEVGRSQIGGGGLDLDHLVESPGSVAHRLLDDLQAIGGGDRQDTMVATDAVQLVHQLSEQPALVAAVAALRDEVEIFQHDDGRSEPPGQLIDLGDIVELGEVTWCDPQERAIEPAGKLPAEGGLAVSRRSGEDQAGAGTHTELREAGRFRAEEPLRGEVDPAARLAGDEEDLIVEQATPFEDLAARQEAAAAEEVLLARHSQPAVEQVGGLARERRLDADDGSAGGFDLFEPQYGATVRAGEKEHQVQRHLQVKAFPQRDPFEGGHPDLVPPGVETERALDLPALSLEESRKELPGEGAAQEPERGAVAGGAFDAEKVIQHAIGRRVVALDLQELGEGGCTDLLQRQV